MKIEIKFKSGRQETYFNLRSFGIYGARFYVTGKNETISFNPDDIEHLTVSEQTSHKIVLRQIS